MVTEVLEMSVQQPTRVKCGAHFCDNFVDTTKLGTPTFKGIGYIGPLDGRVYCKEKDYDDSIDQ